MSLRKIIKNRGSFPNDEAALKLLYLALRNVGRGLEAIGAVMDRRPPSICDTVCRSPHGVSALRP
jgi:hypothetical protein